jgi:hypothetical protein
LEIHPEKVFEAFGVTPYVENRPILRTVPRQGEQNAGIGGTAFIS